MRRPRLQVGCVIVKDGQARAALLHCAHASSGVTHAAPAPPPARRAQIIGEGYHPRAGEPHAEVFALRAAGADAEAATAYVSLEPCNHYGRTPPCSGALVAAKVARVVVGCGDPNPLVAGQGIATLRKAGIAVAVGAEEEACRALNKEFMERMAAAAAAAAAAKG